MEQKPTDLVTKGLQVADDPIAWLLHQMIAIRVFAEESCP